MLFVGACRPTNPLDEKVFAETMEGLTTWQGRMSGRLTLSQRSDLAVSLQSIKLKIMADQEARGTDAVNAAFCAKIHGLPISQVLRIGMEARVVLLERQRIDLEFFLRENAGLRTRPGDGESAGFLARQRVDQTNRLRAAEKEIAELQQKLARLPAPSGKNNSEQRPSAGAGK